jgi:hypothetical protein
MAGRPPLFNSPEELQFMPHKLVMTLAGIDSYATLKHYEGESESSTIEQALEKIPTNKPLMKKAL